MSAGEVCSRSRPDRVICSPSFMRTQLPLNRRIRGSIATWLASGEVTI